MTVDDTWDDASIVSSIDATTPVEYLVAAGLSEEESKHVVEVAGISSMVDLLLLEDTALLKEVAKEAKIKLIPCKKLSNAILALVQKPLAAKDAEKNDSAPVVEAADTNDNKQPTLDECVVVAIDRSGSMGCGFDEAKAFGANAEKTLLNRSRMDAVKQVFYAFRDRTETLESYHKVGLIQFDKQIEEMLQPTSDPDRFDAVVDDMKQRGSTAIYSAIQQSCRMLKPFAADNEKTDLRVLLLTDGQNNAGISPQEALKDVQEIGAVVDAILVGDSCDDNLRKIVAASGGSCFQIHSLSDGFELMEAEAVVSIRSRRGGAEKPERKQAAPVDFDSIKTQKITQARYASTIATCPTTKVLETQKFVPCSSIVRPPGVKGRRARMFKELADFAAANDEGIHLYPNENNVLLSEMKTLIEGPRGTPFEGGVFLLDISLPANYPFGPPKVRFETPIFHCNVDSSGGLCLDILRDSWSPAKTIPEVLRVIRELMSNPNSNDAMRPTIAELYFASKQSGGADTRYVDRAEEATRKDASRSVGEWHALWGIPHS